MLSLEPSVHSSRSSVTQLTGHTTDCGCHTAVLQRKRVELKTIDFTRHETCARIQYLKIYHEIAIKCRRNFIYQPNSHPCVRFLFLSYCQWRRAFMFSLICARTNGWINNLDKGDLIRHRAHYDVIVMLKKISVMWYVLWQIYLIKLTKPKINCFQSAWQLTV